MSDMVIQSDSPIFGYLLGYLRLALAREVGAQHIAEGRQLALYDLQGPN